MMKRMMYQWMTQQPEPDLLVATSLLVMGLLFMSWGWWG